MLQYKLEYDGNDCSVKNSEGNLVIWPTSVNGFEDFLCNLVETCLIPNKEKVEIEVPENLADYHARLVDLFVGFYNAVSEEKKPLSMEDF